MAVVVVAGVVGGDIVGDGGRYPPPSLNFDCGTEFSWL